MGIKVTFCWVRIHTGIDGNERADKAAKHMTNQKITMIPKKESFALLAHINRATTDTKWQECKDWFIQKCAGHKAYYLVPMQRVDKEASRAPKRIAPRYYQMKTEHALICTNHKHIKKSGNHPCWWCTGSPRQTWVHLFKECRRWRRAQNEL